MITTPFLRVRLPLSCSQRDAERQPKSTFNGISLEKYPLFVCGSHFDGLSGYEHLRGYFPTNEECTDGRDVADPAGVAER